MNQPSVGWIGTGVMGSHMARRLLEAGYRLSIWSRTRSKAEPLLAAGATWCDDASDVARRSQLICTMVGYPADVQEVYFGERGILAELKKGQACVDFTSSDPSLAERIAAAAAEKEAVAIDSPVSGGDIGARDGKLSIMVGGDRRVFDGLADFWAVLGKTAVHQGGPGAGQRTKLTNQILVASSMIGVCEAIAFARDGGLDPETVLQSVSGGAAASWALSNLAPRMLKGDYEPGFYVEHFVKDLGLVLAECERLQIELPGVKVAAELYRQLESEGFGRKGTQAAIELVQRRSRAATTTGNVSPSVNLAADASR